MKLNRQQIQAKALGVLEDHPLGIRWMDLLRATAKGEADTPHNSIHGALHALLSKSDQVVKITKGTYVLAKFLDKAEDSGQSSVATVVSPPPTHLEHLYYAAFADWLTEELEEVNHAVSVGGSVLKGKWGTPDVIGVLRPKTSDLVKFEPEIVSAEIKTEQTASVVAFGQAVAYRLFSHKSYLVLPDTTSKPDLERTEALATLYGIGLVTFSLDPESPNFTLKIRATPARPDVFYLNEMARRLLEHDSKLFSALFG